MMPTHDAHHDAHAHPVAITWPSCERRRRLHPADAPVPTPLPPGPQSPASPPHSPHFHCCRRLRLTTTASASASSSTTTTLNITRPDDWHLRVRDLAPLPLLQAPPRGPSLPPPPLPHLSPLSPSLGPTIGTCMCGMGPPCSQSFRTPPGTTVAQSSCPT